MEVPDLVDLSEQREVAEPLASMAVQVCERPAPEVCPHLCNLGSADLLRRCKNSGAKQVPELLLADLNLSSLGSDCCFVVIAERCN